MQTCTHEREINIHINIVFNVDALCFYTQKMHFCYTYVISVRLYLNNIVFMLDF